MIDDLTNDENECLIFIHSLFNAGAVVQYRTGGNQVNLQIYNMKNMVTNHVNILIKNDNNIHHPELTKTSSAYMSSIYIYYIMYGSTIYSLTY